MSPVLIVCRHSAIVDFISCHGRNRRRIIGTTIAAPVAHRGNVDGVIRKMACFPAYPPCNAGGNLPTRPLQMIEFTLVSGEKRASEVGHAQPGAARFPFHALAPGRSSFRGQRSWWRNLCSANSTGRRRCSLNGNNCSTLSLHTTLVQTF